MVSGNKHNNNRRSAKKTRGGGASRGNPLYPSPTSEHGNSMENLKIQTNGQSVRPFRNDFIPTGSNAYIVETEPRGNCLYDAFATADILQAMHVEKLPHDFLKTFGKGTEKALSFSPVFRYLAAHEFNYNWTGFYQKLGWSRTFINRALEVIFFNYCTAFNCDSFFLCVDSHHDPLWFDCLFVLLLTIYRIRPGATSK